MNVNAALTAVVVVGACVMGLAHPSGAAETAEDRLSGLVTNVKEVGLQGSDVRHLVVRVRTGSDDRIVIDLGPTDALMATPKEGDEISVAGEWGRVGKETVLFASSAEIAGKEIAVQRQHHGQIAGEVLGSHVVGTKEGDTKTRLLVVQSEQGKVAVDLGPEGQLADTEIGEGDRVTVRGALVSVDNYPVLMASALDFDGKTYNIRRD